MPLVVRDFKTANAKGVKCRQGRMSFISAQERLQAAVKKNPGHTPWTKQNPETKQKLMRLTTLTYSVDQHITYPTPHCLQHTINSGF